MDVPKQWLDRAVELDQAEGSVLWAWGDHLLELVPMRPVGRPTAETDEPSVKDVLEEVSTELESLGVVKGVDTLAGYRSTAGAWETSTRVGITYSVARALAGQPDRHDLVFQRDWTKSQAEEFRGIRAQFPEADLEQYEHYLEAKGLDPKLQAKHFFGVNRELALAFHEVVVTSTKLEKMLNDAGPPKGNEEATREVANEALIELNKLQNTAKRRFHALEAPVVA